MPSILENLNPEQRAAAAAVDGPVLIIAGAGSGKTRTLTHRIAHMVGEKGIPPRQILAVTFTNKAAAEMRERIEQLLGQIAGLWVGTFHSTCVRLLREYGEKIGYTRSFTICDESDRNSLLKQVMRDLDYDVNRYPIRNIAYRISDWKNDLLRPSQVLATLGDLPLPPDKVALEAYTRYQERLKRTNSLDFDDLILETVRLLEEHDDIRAQLNRRLRYVLVDEYQDINEAQYRLVRLLTEEHGNLCVVGDDDQSIYGWRGARLEIILQFDEDFPAAKVVKLERNYRSTQAVLDVANAVIANNQERREKTLRTERSGGETVTLHVAGNEYDEAWYVADQIAHLVRSGEARYKDQVVLYRTNAMSRVFEEVLGNRQIPFRLLGGVRFYERREVKDIVAYLRALFNPADDVSHLRIINTPTRGIGAKTVQTVQEHATAHQLTFSEAMEQVIESDLLNTGTRKKLAAFRDIMTRLRTGVETLPVGDLIAKVIRESGYEEDLVSDRTAEASSRLENLDELRTAAGEVTEEVGLAGLEIFLERVALVSDTDSLETGDDKITLMTLHSAKGLEFPVVYFVGLEEGICPHSRSVDSGTGIEEERRLCYVGMTRAADRLYLTYTTRRTVHGQTNFSKRSRFLDEIPPDWLQGAGLTPSIAEPEPARETRQLDQMTTILSRQRRQSAASTPSRVAATPRGARPVVGAPQTAKYKAGQKVRHPEFGDGIVVACGAGGGAEVQVAFPDKGVKRLLVEYAKLETR